MVLCVMRVATDVCARESRGGDRHARSPFQIKWHHPWHRRAAIGADAMLGTERLNERRADLHVATQDGIVDGRGKGEGEGQPVGS